MRPDKDKIVFEREALLAYSTTLRAYETAERVLRDAEAALMVETARQQKDPGSRGMLGRILHRRKQTLALQLGRTAVERAQASKEVWSAALRAVRLAVGSVPTTLRGGGL